MDSQIHVAELSDRSGRVASLRRHQRESENHNECRRIGVLPQHLCRPGNGWSVALPDPPSRRGGRVHQRADREYRGQYVKGQSDLEHDSEINLLATAARLLGHVAAGGPGSR